ncbi:MAG: PIN domain-containing protein [Caldilineae bacterium]|nr:MAG: PIN domain-containing protein [Caldilineae bacterium]
MARYTVDASVFMSAYNTYEVAHEVSRRLLELMRQQGAPLIEPTLLLPEIAASVARVYQDEVLARAFAASVGSLGHLTLMPVDELLADIAVQIAARHRLRGSDAVYAAVAQRYGAVLVTLDQEQYNRVGRVLSTRTPAEALADMEGDEA